MFESKLLESRGWKIGNAREFLKLTDQEEAYVELRLKLADALKRQRMRRNLTQADHGEDHEVQPVACGENGIGRCFRLSLNLLVRSLLAIGTSNKELAKVIAGSKINRKAA